MDKVLVIGGGGYLGSVLVEKLLNDGKSVRILDSFIYGKKSVENFRYNPAVEIIEGDIRNIETVNSAVNGAASVIHLAAVVGDPASKERPDQTIETNYLATGMIALACKLKGISRFIYASTCSVYGVGDDVLDENSALNPVSLYARTKISSEESIMKLADDNFRPTIMRMSTLYGYSPRMRFDLVVNTMTMTGFLENKINVYGGSQWRPLLHIEDAASAYIKILDADIDKVGNKIYNVGSEVQNYRISEVANKVKDSLDRVEIVVNKEDSDARDYRVSFKKIQNEIGFEVKNNIEEAAKEIYKKLKSGEIKNPKQKVYYNHYFDSSEELIG